MATLSLFFVLKMPENSFFWPIDGSLKSIYLYILVLSTGLVKSPYNFKGKFLIQNEP
jgi:hypothetical protein